MNLSLNIYLGFIFLSFEFYFVFICKTDIIIVCIQKMVAVFIMIFAILAFLFSAPQEQGMMNISCYLPYSQTPNIVLLLVSQTEQRAQSNEDEVGRDSSERVYFCSQMRSWCVGEARVTQESRGSSTGAVKAQAQRYEGERDPAPQYGGHCEDPSALIRTMHL